MLRTGGLYVVEDTQTSYWPQYDGANPEDKSVQTTCNYFKELTDGLNHAEFQIPGYETTVMERTITGMYFAHNMIVIEKGRNDQPSNLVVDGRLLDH